MLASAIAILGLVGIAWGCMVAADRAMDEGGPAAVPFVRALIVVATIAAMLAFACILNVAQAQQCVEGAYGCGHATNHDRYKDWNDRDVFVNGLPSKASCCNHEDCRPVKATKDESGNWRIFIPELAGRTVGTVLVKGWLLVPEGTVGPPDRYGDGRSHACSSRPRNPMMPIPLVYCFSPAEPKI